MVAEHGVAVGEQFAGHPAQVIKTAHQALEAHLSGAAAGDANRRHPAAAKDGHHRVQLDQVLAERPPPEMLPVRLGLHPGQRLEPDLGFPHQRRAQWPHLAQEGPVAADVSIAGAELPVQVGAADHRAHRQPALDVSSLSRREGVQRHPGRILARPTRLELAGHGAPVDVEVAGERADAPSVLVQNVQFHPELLRLHEGPSWCWWLRTLPSLPGGTSSFPITTRSYPPPRTCALFVLRTAHYSCSPTQALEPRDHAASTERLPIEA